MTHQEDHKVIAAMRTYGDGFVRALAGACDRADDNNLRRIKGAFPDLWKEYAYLAERATDRDEL